MERQKIEARIAELEEEMETLRALVGRVPQGVRWGGWSSAYVIEEAQMARIRQEIARLRAQLEKGEVEA